MKERVYDVWFELVDDIDREQDKLKEEFGSKNAVITIIAANFEEAKNIVEDLIISGYDFSSINMNDYEFDDYYDEYIIGISDGDFFCTPAKENGKYVHDFCDICFISSEANSIIIKNIDAMKYIEFRLKNNDEDSYDLDKNDNYSFEDYFNNLLSEQSDKITVKKNGKEVKGEEANVVLKEMIDEYNEYLNSLEELENKFYKFKSNIFNHMWL